MYKICFEKSSVFLTFQPNNRTSAEGKEQGIIENDSGHWKLFQVLICADLSIKLKTNHENIWNFGSKSPTADVQCDKLDFIPENRYFF